MDGLGIDYHLHHQHQHHNHGPFSPQQLPLHPPRKRKAEAIPENNERLSKRMSLLNLEQSGQKLYVPVENPNPQLSDAIPKTHHHHHKPKHASDPSQMELDDSKYKVYIYNLDDELSSSDNETDTGSDSGKLVFLPDIEKHLRNNRRIPAHVLNPCPDPAEWAAGKELVLYREPSSLSVPEEQDSVRKAILEARARAREKQRVEREQAVAAPPVVVPVPAVTSSVSLGDVPMDAEPLLSGLGEEDPDAMELD